MYFKCNTIFVTHSNVTQLKLKLTKESFNYIIILNKIKHNLN
jgi:hypothetical protein